MANDTRDRLIETTARLLQERGYHGTALGDVLAESRAPRGSLYFHFPGGKDELVAEATRGGIEAVTDSLRDGLARGTSPARAIRLLLEASAAALAANDYRFGSPTAPLVLDALAAGSPIAMLTQDAYETWIGLFEAALVSAGLATRQARSLAILVEASFEGLLIVARARRNIAPMLAGARELETVIAAALPKRSGSRGKQS